jgi:hypothetical protein
MPNGAHPWEARDRTRGYSGDQVIPFTATQRTFLQHMVDSVPPAAAVGFLGGAAVLLYAYANRGHIANAAVTYLVRGGEIPEPPAEETQHQQQLLQGIVVPAANGQGFLPTSPAASSRGSL